MCEQVASSQNNKGQHGLLTLIDIVKVINNHRGNYLLYMAFKELQLASSLATAQFKDMVMQQ